MRLLAAAAAVVLAATAPAAGADDGVTASATLHLRSTSTRRTPDALVLYDPARASFDADRYLRPEGGDSYGAAFASVRLDGALAGGDLRWVLAADTGELRRRAFPEAVDVCLVARQVGMYTSPTGLSTEPGCQLRHAVVPLESTTRGPAALTSNGRPLREEVRKTLLLREAYVAWSFGRAGFATVRAGRKRVSIADGLVHDDYSTGVELDLDLGALGPRWDVSVGVFQPTRDLPGTLAQLSPVAVARADFLPSLFERAGVFVAGMRDRSGSLAELVRSSVIEAGIAEVSRTYGTGTAAEFTANRALALALSAPLQSDASIGWLGTSGRLAPLRGQRLDWTLALQGGTLHRLTSTGAAGTSVWDEDVPLRGRLASVRWNVDLGEKVSAGASLLYLSGGLPPVRGPRGNPLPGRDASYDAFLGISPFVTATNLFFGGGLSDTFAARQVSAPGVNGRGVVAPGVSLTVDPHPRVSVQGKAAWLRSDVTGPFGGRIYGTEADLDVTWSPRDWLLVGVELDALWPGDFYPARDTVYKTVFAVDLVTP